MSDQTGRILKEVLEGEKLIEVHTSHSKSFKNNIRGNEKSRQRNADGNKDSTIQQNDEVIILFNQQFRNAKTTMLRFQNLQRARFLK